MQKLGALWHKVSSKGVGYYSGVVEIKGMKTQLVAFHGKKEKPNQPDIEIFLSEPRPELEKKVEEEQANQEALNEEELSISDIPF